MAVAEIMTEYFREICILYALKQFA